MGIQQEVAKLEHSAEIELFVIDASNTDGEVYRFHAGTNELSGPIVWQNEKYERRQVRLSDFTQESGQRPRPTISIAKRSGADERGEYTMFAELEGARVIRIMTLARYLDPINFPKSENPHAGPEALPPEEYIVRRRASDNFTQVELELGTPDDALNRLAPGRQVTRKCWAVYRDISTGCDWRPRGVFYNLDNERVLSESEDKCPHSIEGCETRFGQGRPLPFMGSPTAGLIQQ